MSVGIVVMSAVPMVQLHLTEHLHPLDHHFPPVAIRTLAIAAVGAAAALLAVRLPDIIALPLIVLLAAAAIWLSVRFALPLADRASLGKTGRRLGLVPADQG